MSKKTKRNIGIVGFGMVGKQLKRWFESKKYEVFVYDKFKKSDSLKSLNNTQLIFLCLPTAYKNNRLGISTSVFKGIVKFFKKPKVFIIKSTIPPGTTNKFQKLFKKHYFLHNPEFLTESSAWKDFSKPALQLIGYTSKSKKIAKDILKILPEAEYSKILSATETEIFKYARNAFFATKVIFANQIYDLCKLFNSDYDNIKELMINEPWIGGNHLQVLHKDYRGFGGKCLPKDLKTFIKVFKSKKIKPELFEVVDKINNRLLERQKLDIILRDFWLNNVNN